MIYAKTQPPPLPPLTLSPWIGSCHSFSPAPNNFKVLVLSARGRDSLTLKQIARLENLAEVHYQCITAPVSAKQFVELAAGYDFLAITRRSIDRLERETLMHLPKLKGISVYSTGTEWIDTAYLQAQGIYLASLQSYSTNAVAETALGLLFVSAHKLHLRYLKTIHTIPEHVSLRGRELKHGTVGILGYGRIGKLLTAKIQALCKQVLVHDIDPAQTHSIPAGVVAVGKSALLQSSDWVVCCASQQFEEKSILEVSDYEMLRPKTTVINVGRTSLLDHDRLIEMAQGRQICGYFYDDLMKHEEDPDALDFGRIVPIGHTAWYTDEAMEAGTDCWVKNLEILIKENMSKSIPIC